MKNCTRILTFVFVLSLLVSCRTKKEMVYFQGNANMGEAAAEVYEPIIQPDDILYVAVQSQNIEATEPFVFKNDQIAGGVENNQLRGYLVDKEGYIIFPVLGRIKVSGQTRTNLIQDLNNKIRVYVTDAVVSVRILNFKVSVLGEVRVPGQVTMRGDRMTILEAIAQAGDLTVQGTRENVLIIREDHGKKTFFRVNLTDANLINSPYYYLKQNDVVYVEPKRAAYNVSGIGPYLTTTASILSLLVTSTILIFRL